MSGVTAFDGADQPPVPSAFTAAIRNVYVVALASPVIVSVVAGETNVIGDSAVEPLNGVTMYATIGAPLAAGAVHVSEACDFPGTAVGAAGASGTPSVTPFDGRERRPVPFAFLA